MSVAERIKDKLTQEFAPERLDVIDESHLHAGHAGARPEGETHFRIEIVSSAFEGLNRVARQRAVNATLKEELAGPVHALSMKLSAPGE
ncbi:MAG: BolA family protein [Pseudomonadota bacterium]